jgi:hypothetical protein
MNYKDFKTFQQSNNPFLRVVGGLGCVGKETTLLQAEASVCGQGLQMCCFVRGLFIILFFFFCL